MAASPVKLTARQTLALRKIAVNRTWGVGSWRDSARVSRPIELPRLKLRIDVARALEKKGLINVSAQSASVGWGNEGAAVTLTAAGLEHVLAL